MPRLSIWRACGLSLQRDTPRMQATESRRSEGPLRRAYAHKPSRPTPALSVAVARGRCPRDHHSARPAFRLPVTGSSSMPLAERRPHFEVEGSPAPSVDHVQRRTARAVRRGARLAVERRQGLDPARRMPATPTFCPSAWACRGRVSAARCRRGPQQAEPFRPVSSTAPHDLWASGPRRRHPGEHARARALRCTLARQGWLIHP